MDTNQLRTRFTRLLRQAQAADRLSRATGSIEALLDDEAGNGQMHMAAGLAFADVRLVVSARRALETAQTLVPLSPEAELTLADCYVESKDAAPAVTLLQNVGMRRDSPCMLRLRAAGRLEKLGRQRTGWMICRRAVEDFPEEPQAWLDLSYFMGRVGSPFRRIESAARRAIDLAPEVAGYRISLASALFQRDRALDAYQLIRNLGREQIDDVTCDCCLKRLSQIYQVAGDSDRYRQCLNRLASVPPSDGPPENMKTSRPSGESS